MDSKSLFLLQTYTRDDRKCCRNCVMFFFFEGPEQNTICVSVYVNECSTRMKTGMNVFSRLRFGGSNFSVSRSVVRISLQLEHVVVDYS